MTPFYALIYILAYSESYTVAQKLSHRYVYLSIIFYKCSYTKTFKTQNDDHFKQPIMATLMQNSLHFHSGADHFMH